MTAPDPAAIRTQLDAAERTAKAAAASGEVPEAFDGSVQDFLDLFHPAAVLCHLAAARQILDSAVEQLAEHSDCDCGMGDSMHGVPDRPCPDRRRALATLTALAAAWQPEQQENR